MTTFLGWKGLLDPEVCPAQQVMLSIANRKSFLVHLGQLGQREMLVHRVFPVRTEKLDHKARKVHPAASELPEKRANKVTRGTRGYLDNRERKEKKEQLALMVPQEPQEQSDHLVKTATPENQGPLVLKAKLVRLVSQSKALDLLVQQE